MKKLIALVLSLALCFSLLAGCGGKSGNNAASNNNAAPADKADDTVYSFTVVNHDSATSLGEKYLETLFGAIEAESNGRLKFNYFPGGSMFGATETIDAVKDGAADICWATTGTYGGIFPACEFINLVGNGINSAQIGSAVLNIMYEEMPEVQNELKNWKVLAVHGTSNAPLSTVGKKIEKPEDLKGMQIRAAGTIPTLYLNTVGATAIAMPTSEVYEALSKNVINGMANDWHNIDCFNLFEAVDYCMDIQLNQTSSFVFMNQAKWDALPDDLKAIFDKYFASGFAADMAGYWWDSCRYFVGDKMRENGVEVYEPTQEMLDHLFDEASIAAVHADYVKYLNDKGLDGQAIYDKGMEIVARVSADYANVWDNEFSWEDWDMAAVEGYQPKW